MKNYPVGFEEWHQSLLLELEERKLTTYRAPIRCIQGMFNDFYNKKTPKAAAENFIINYYLND